MPIQPVPAAPATVPFPGLNEKAAGTYNAAAFAWGNQMPAYADGIKGLGDNVFNNATEAKGNADLTVTKAGEAAAARDGAVEAALSALNAPGTKATSASSLSLSAGVKSIVLDQLGKEFAKGQFVTVALDADPTKQAGAIILDFVSGTGAMSLAMGEPTAPGTYSGWSISVGAAPSVMARLEYENRANLRAASSFPGGAVMVEGLGMFLYVPGSTEIDDDESCFSTGSGCWLLEAAGFEFTQAWLAMSQASFGTPTTILHGRANCQVTSIISGARTTFSGTVLGTNPGDRVLVSPSKSISAVGMSVYAWVSAANTVTVDISMPGATGGVTGTGMDGFWLISVFKEG